MLEIYTYRVYNICIKCGGEVCMRKRMNISLDPETANQLKKLAEQSHMNMSQWITQAVWNDSKKKSEHNRKVKYNG